MLSSFVRNLQSFLWALAMAFAVWIAAVTAADPDEVRIYPTPIKVEVVGQDPGLIINGTIPKEIQVTLRAPQSIWNQLTTHPEGVRAILDLSGLSSGEHRLDLQIQVDARPVRIVTVNPSSVSLTLEPLVTRSLALQSTLSGQPAIGYLAGDLTIDPKEVVIVGPQSIVSRVTRVRVAVDLTGIRENIDQSVPIEVLDQNNATVTGLSIHPEKAHVALPVSRQGGFRDMAVKVIVHGQVAGGYRLDSISVFPPVVTVFSSNPDLTNALPGVVETQPLDLQNASDNLNLRVPLNLPAGVSVVGPQTVLIQAGISPIQSSLTLSEERVEVTGLSADMTYHVSPATVDVILSGPLPILDTLTRQDVHVTVDVQGLGAGTYQLTPTVQILASSVSVESLLPGTVEVILFPTPVPTTKP
jgi:YbbR domain-containing protein